MKPNFLIIGAPRCGTTFLAQNLATHPDVFIATGDDQDIAGDVHFFDPNTPEGRNNRKKGEHWYYGLFSGAETMTAVGEKTADYLVDPEAPELIGQSLGRPAIIVILRDPVERAWSHFCHSRHRLPQRLKFADLVNSQQDVAEVPILRAGLYYQLLEPYIRKFGEEHVLVLIQEELDCAPVAELTRVCQFLGVSTGHFFPYLDQHINAGSSNPMAWWAGRMGRTLQLRFPGTYNWLLQGPLSGIIQALVRLTRGKTAKQRARNAVPSSALDMKLRRQLLEFYRPDSRKIAAWLEKDLEHLWWGLLPKSEENAKQ